MKIPTSNLEVKHRKDNLRSEQQSLQGTSDAESVMGRMILKESKWYSLSGKKLSSMSHDSLSAGALNSGGHMALRGQC